MSKRPQVKKASGVGRRTVASGNPRDREWTSECPAVQQSLRGRVGGQSMDSSGISLVMGWGSV